LFFRKNIARILYIACALICAAIAGCEPRTGPEEAVRQWVENARAALEGSERSVLEDMIAEGYADARGNDKADVRQMLRMWFLRSGSIVLVSKIDEVTLLGDSAATVSLTVGMAGPSEGMFGLDADALRFELELETTGDDWLLIGARWGKPGGQLR
jgi:hypothetical protein